VLIAGDWGRAEAPSSVLVNTRRPSLRINRSFHRRRRWSVDAGHTSRIGHGQRQRPAKVILVVRRCIPRSPAHPWARGGADGGPMAGGFWRHFPGAQQPRLHRPMSAPVLPNGAAGTLCCSIRRNSYIRYHLGGLARRRSEINQCPTSKQPCQRQTSVIATNNFSNPANSQNANIFSVPMPMSSGIPIIPPGTLSAYRNNQLASGGTIANTGFCKRPTCAPRRTSTGP